MIESWKPVTGYDGFYEVSNYGKVRSVDRMVKCGNKFLKIFGKELSQAKDAHGYRRVSLTRNGKGKTKKVHRLVAQAFIPNPNSLPEVNHISGDKSDNSIFNLEWIGRRKNIEHAKNNGFYKSIPKKLSKQEVREIRQLYKPYSTSGSSIALSLKYGVSAPYIWRIVHGEKRRNA